MNINTCLSCNKTFSSISALNKHKRTIHTDEKPFSCDICKLKFREKGNLVKHKSVHSSDKPYRCTVCKKAFRQKNVLKQHEKIHTGEKKFSCDVRDISFSG